MRDLKKMKKGLVFGICVALIAIAFVGITMNMGAVPTNVWVDDNFDSSTPGWGETHFNAIQDGINAVDTDGTVTVYEGMYFESVDVYKSVTIEGEGQATLVPEVESSGKRGDGFRVIASDVTIKGFKIIGNYGGILQSYNSPGIIIGGLSPGDLSNLGVEGVTISNNIFYDCWCGIYIWKSSNNILIGNTIHDMEYRGIQIYDGSTNAQILQGFPSQNNQIIDNEIYDALGGISIGAYNPPPGGLHTDNSGTIIKDNYLHDLTDFALGFMYTDSTNVEITGNTMNDNLYGISVYWWGIADLTDTIVIGNTINSNIYGIILGTCNQWLIAENDITNNLYGISVSQSIGIEIHENRIIGNKFGIQNNIESEAVEEWLVNAINNWWGHNTGPYHSTTWDYLGIPYGPNLGKGDKVSDYVLYAPWDFGKITIDIKPEDTINNLNLKSKGRVPVVILSNKDFDATLVDPNTVEFAEAPPAHWTIDDINFDGIMDLLFHFRTQQMNLDQNSFEATLTGLTQDGGGFWGSDSVNIKQFKEK